MEFIFRLRFLIKIIFVIMLMSVITVINSKNVFADDIEKFASKLFNHYEYDDKITNSLKSFFSFGNNDIESFPVNTINNPKSTPKKQKSFIKIKSKNKITYNFENGQSVQINPSNIVEKIIFSNSPFTFFEIKKDTISYGIDIDF